MSPPRCRFCRATEGEIVLDLGHQPACDHFPIAGAPLPDHRHLLRMWLCAVCGLAQLAEDGTAYEEPRGIEPEALVAQARDAVDRVIGAALLRPGATVAEYGSPHGGSWLELLAERGMRRAGPADRADVVLDCFGLMHSRDQQVALDERVDRLAPDGVLLLQYHSLASIVAGNQWNALRHGHFAYYSTPALLGMLETAGLGATTAWRFDLYGGTVLLAARRGGRPDRSVLDLMCEETTGGILRSSIVATLQDAASTSASSLRAFLEQTRERGERVLGYGAASRAVVLLNHAGVGLNLLPAVVDASDSKQGRCIPGVRIPIIETGRLTADRLLVDPVDAVILFVPDLLGEVRQMYPGVERSGAHWMLAEPSPHAVEPASTTIVTSEGSR